MTQILRARRLLTEQGWLDDHQLRIEEGVITAIEPISVGTMLRDAELLAPLTSILTSTVAPESM
jgi:N-acetylgalactosamine-6-phosphate deacetylase